MVLLFKALGLILPRGVGIPVESVEDFFLHSCESAAETMRQCILEHDVTESALLLQARGVELHLIHGERDKVVPIELAEQFSARFKATLHIVPDVGHLLPLEAQHAFECILCDIIKPP